MYEGIVAGNKWDESGSSTHLCLHTQPNFLATTPGKQTWGRTYLSAVEYQGRHHPPAFGNLRNHDVPCAVCYSSGRTATITIPGRTSCPSSWTREYFGYLMAARHGYKSRAPFCIDINAESVPGNAANHPAAELFFMETTCNGLCPPYVNGAEVTCAVCTK